MNPPPPALETGRPRIRPLAAGDLEDGHRPRVDIGWADLPVSDAANREIQGRWLDWTRNGYREFDRRPQP